MNGTTVNVDNLCYEFGTDGFLSNVFVLGFNNRRYLANRKNFGRIQIYLSDSRELFPYCKEQPVVDVMGDVTIVEFTEIRWRDASGENVDNFRLSLCYELMEGGRAFVNAFFYSNDMASPDLDLFDLKFDFASGDFSSTQWGFVPRPKKIDASMIQAMRSGRGLNVGDQRFIDHEITPSIGLNLRSQNGESAYFEVFVEGENDISGNGGDCSTNFHWCDNGDLQATYSFVRNHPCKNKLMQQWQWRNQWGWVLKTADKTRQKPPFHMYHYFDNYERYPSDSALDNMAKWGADVLVLHENWRFDIQNGGVPANRQAFLKTIRKAHELGIRVALYIRGNENSVMDGACEWFDRYLKKDFDGLYMDYGGPFHQNIPDESFPGGRIPFKEYYLRMKALRTRIGEDGLFFGHTGTSYSALWYTKGIDGYVSGEGEGGIMVSNRNNHEYYSMASVSPGTMWTGAFPAYSTAKMRPFLVAAGQYPHSPLGEQFQTSSLAHPREPGVNDIAFRPAWKIWKPFRNERNITVLNDYNSSGVFKTDAKNVGFYLMVSHDAKRALLCVANFSESENQFHLSLNHELCAFSSAGKKAWRLTPTENSPGKADEVNADDFSFCLKKWDVGAILIESDVSEGLKHIAEFETSYPNLSKENIRHLTYLEEQKSVRNVGPCKSCSIRLSTPNTNQPYEYSLIYDLYYNAMALVEFLPDGSKKRLGWISQRGFTEEQPNPEDYIWPDVTSPAISLEKILGPGDHFVGIESVHYDAPFYSFISVEVTTDTAQPQVIRFANELEPNREFIRWHVSIV